MPTIAFPYFPLHHNYCIDRRCLVVSTPASYSPIWEVSGSNVDLQIGYPGRVFSWYSLVPVGRCRDSILNWATTTSFHIFSSSLFINHSIILRCIIQATDGFVKYTSNKYINESQSIYHSVKLKSVGKWTNIRHKRHKMVKTWKNYEFNVLRLRMLSCSFFEIDVQNGWLTWSNWL
jgi:hypothetical protein